ncbi:hypothetical protein [Rhodobacter viridis]|nr:hypothetical protein [Rhodobacter viridis]
MQHDLLDQRAQRLGTVGRVLTAFRFFAFKRDEVVEIVADPRD